MNADALSRNPVPMSSIVPPGVSSDFSHVFQGSCEVVQCVEVDSREVNSILSDSSINSLSTCTLDEEPTCSSSVSAAENRDSS